MSSYDLLSGPIKKYVRDKRWEELRPIQDAAIMRIITTEDNYILASKTASGKTEAAFLPILSKVNFNESGVQVLYISPLIALINDQFNRVEELCKYLEVTVTKWHGEANRTLKEHVIKEPSGIVLITPESLEAMFVNKPYNVKHLFSNLKYVVIDEIHSFIGSDRGIQLKSLLSRLQDVNIEQFKIVGLSATLGDYEEAKNYTGDAEHTKVLLDKTSKEITAVFRYFKGEGNELPLDLLKDLYIETKDDKVLIFPNSRGRVEEVAVKLKKISDRVKGHPNYFSHHSSVDKEVREYVEYFAKNNNRHNFCISCTSTLELGIDIGSVDEVVQIDATHSIASMIQRVGRSGRKDGALSSLYLYATTPWSLLQSIACWLLYQERFIEPPESGKQSYDILLHQILSIVKGHSGILIKELLHQVKNNFAFKDIAEIDIVAIANHLIAIDFLEQLQQEVIIGVEGEKVVNSRDFYSAFTIEDTFKVVHAGNRIGELPFSPQLREDENILLAAKIWKIIFIDFKAKKIEVVPAKDGKKPIFSGSGGIVHQKIREKMLSVLYTDTQYEFLNQSSQDALQEMRKQFLVFPMQDLELQRPLLVAETKLSFYTFSSTKINRTLALLFEIIGVKSTMDDSSSMFYFHISKDEFIQKWQYLLKNANTIDDLFTQYLQEHPDSIITTKWGQYLPEKFQTELMKRNYFDVRGSIEFLDLNIDLVLNKSV
jgi:ATP-dependent Lhr-like helicase